MTATPETLTERYVTTVVHHVPEKSRADVSAELRASIADDIDARVAAGAASETAERDALLALGDPHRLAAEYAGTPLHLIGPVHFLEWRRLTVMLLSIVLPIVAGAITIARALAGDGPIDIVLGVLGTVASVAVGLVFWVTVVFAILERTPSGAAPLARWSLDDLPEGDRRPQVGVGDLVGGILGLLVIVVLVVGQAVASPVRDETGAVVPVLDPALWSWWIPYIIVISAAELLLVVMLYQRRRWSFGAAIANIILNVAAAVPLVVLVATDSVINPAFSSSFEEEQGLIELGQSAAVGVAIAIAALALWNSIEGVVKAARARG